MYLLWVPVLTTASSVFGVPICGTYRVFGGPEFGFTLIFNEPIGGKEIQPKKIAS